MLDKRFQDDARILIPSGSYEVGYTSHSAWVFAGKQPKLTINFRILTMGEHYEKPIRAFYNVKSFKKRKRSPAINVGWSSDFMLDYSTCFEVPERTDRFNWDNFKKHILLAKVKSVRHNRKQRPLPNGLQYSIIDQLVGIVQP